MASVILTQADIIEGFIIISPILQTAVSAEKPMNETTMKDESNFTIAIHFIHDYILVYASANETLNNSPKEKRKDVRLLYLGIIGYICTQIKKT